MCMHTCVVSEKPGKTTSLLKNIIDQMNRLYESEFLSFVLTERNSGESVSEDVDIRQTITVCC